MTATPRGTCEAELALAGTSTPVDRLASSSMPRAVLVLLVVVLSLLATTSVAAPLAELDRRAREQALALLEGARTPAHRRDYQLELPEIPSRLPALYSIRHYATRGHFGGAHAVIDVERDVEGTRVELLDTKGLARGSVPADELDALVRLAFYLCLARAETHAPEPIWWGRNDHRAARKLRIEGEAFLLVTDFERPIFEELDGPDLDGFVLTEIAERFEALVRAHVGADQRLARDEALGDMERRLQAIPAGDVSLSDARRTDRDATLAGLIGDHFVAAGLEQTMPLLQRKRLDRQAYELSLRITPMRDVLAVLPTLLCSAASEVHEPALGFVARHRELAHEAVLEALGCELSEDQAEMLLRQLLRTSAIVVRDAERSRNLHNLYPLLAEHQSARNRLLAARVLWVFHHDDAAGRWLHDVAIGSVPETSERARVEALEVLAAGVSPRDPARRSIVELALATLGGMPMEDLQADPWLRVLEIFVSHGEPGHVDALLPWLDHPDPELLVGLVATIERLDPERMVSEAHERVRRYARGESKVGYERAVLPFVELLVRRDEEAMVTELRAATEPLCAEVPEASAPLRQFHGALVAYLATVPRRRTDAAMKLAARVPWTILTMTTVLIERHGLDEDAVDRAQRAFYAELPDPG